MELLLPIQAAGLAASGLESNRQKRVPSRCRNGPERIYPHGRVFPSPRRHSSTMLGLACFVLPRLSCACGLERVPVASAYAAQ